MNKTFLLLGGYGGTGQRLVPLLLKETDIRIRLAGRNLGKAQTAAAHWNSVFEGQRVEAIRADAADPISLVQACAGVQLVLVASCTAQFTQNIALAALDAGADYLDIMFPPGKLPVLRSLSGRMLEEGRCFITEAGFHPGIVAALVHHAARHFDRLEKAIVSTVIRMKVEGPLPESLSELVEAFSDYRARIFKDRQWQDIQLTTPAGFYQADFGPRFGRLPCAPMYLEELQMLPELIPSLEETGFYAGGFNWFVDNLVIPAIMLALSICPKAALKPSTWLMYVGLKYFSRPPWGATVKLDAAGRQGEKSKSLNLLLYHENEYMLTAIPVVACLLQYLDGSIKKPGLWLMGHAVEPTRLLADMQRLGVDLQTGDWHSGQSEAKSADRA